jgi:predicted RNA-binding Zn ribbon-like protein
MMYDRNLSLNLELKSGHPSLEFTNTVSNHASDDPGETLFNYEDVLAWAKRIGLLRAEQVDKLTHKSAGQPREANRVFLALIELRETIYRIFVAKVKDRAPAQEDLRILNSVLSRLTSGAQVVHSADRFEWQWNVHEDALEAPLWLLALSAVDLLTSEYYQRVGQCADEDGCGWLFVDTSKNHSRRWCDINDCGNRAKQRRYQKRVQKKKS